jgi:hypothetical protein
MFPQHALGVATPGLFQPRSLCNEYQLSSSCETTGWDPSIDDVNGLNAYKMRPIEVAAQAGNDVEFRAIMTHPDFDPKGCGPRFFLAVGSRYWEYFDPQRLVRMGEALKDYAQRFCTA